MGDGREVQEGGDMCISMVDSCCCMAETNTTLQSNYLPIKNKNKLKKIFKLLSHATQGHSIHTVFAN